MRDYKDFPIKVTISLGIVNEIQKGRTAKLAEQISKHLTLDHENYVHWKLDIGHLSLDFEDTGLAGLGKLVSLLEARMDHKHLWLTRKNLPGNKVHQDRWCTVVFTTLCWCLPSCAAVHCCIVMDELLVAALQGWFAKVTLDTGQSYLHHTTTNWETWQRHRVSINC